MSETVDREFSIIIPSYNYARYLPRAIESTLAQRGDDFETIVVDDWSTDSTAQVAQDYCACTGGRVRYIFQDNQGPGAARNRGVALSRGRYFVFLDSDDAMLPDALHRFRSAFSQGTWVDFVWGGVLNRLPDGAIVSQPSGSITSDKFQNFQYHVADCLGISGCRWRIGRWPMPACPYFACSINWDTTRKQNWCIALRLGGISVRDTNGKIFVGMPGYVSRNSSDNMTRPDQSICVVKIGHL